MRIAGFTLWMLLLWGCEASPNLDGRWTGVSTSGKQGGFNYVLDLDVSEQEVTGQGSVAIYNAPGLASDTTFGVHVQGTYHAPELTLVIEAPAMRTGGRAEFRGVLTAEGEKIEGVLSSALTGRLPLVLQHQGKR